MFKKIIISIFLVLLAMATPVYAYDSQTPIRVGISDTSFSTYNFNKAEFYSDGIIEVTDSSTGETIKVSGESVVIKMEEGYFEVYKGKALKLQKTNGCIVIKPDANSLIGIKNINRAGKPAFYRGIIELTPIKKKPNFFAIVNILDLQSYLKGVVPNEMPVYFGIEALKAQCIAARNYALRPRSKFYDEFDICDSVACQVYFGAKTEKALSNKAVEETDGLVALYNDELILALYSSTAGGYTENYENAFADPTSKKFPGKEIPYLKARPDIPDMKNLSNEKDAREFYSTRPETFDNNSSYFRWTREWKLSEFIKMLNTTMMEQKAFVKPHFDEYDKFEKLKEIKIKQRGLSGKVMFIEIYTEKGQYTIGKELTIRRLFKKDGKALPSANFVCDMTQDDKSAEPTIKFTGGGFGHGVGMSQYGAGKMGQSGLNFISILQHYYTGITIGTIPVTISSQFGKNAATQSFYSPDGKAFISVDDVKGINEITVVINGIETDLDLGKFIKKNRIKIDKYVRKGRNSIEYNIPTDYYGQKQIKLHVEIIGAG